MKQTQTGVGLTNPLNPIYNRLGSNVMPRNIGWLMRAMGQEIDFEGSEEFFILDPPYQRENVWSEEQSLKFVGFILEGGISPAIYLKELKGYGYEVGGNKVLRDVPFNDFVRVFQPFLFGPNILSISPY